jgi:hypothetical protein
MFSFYLVVVFLMRTLFTAIVIDTYKREAMKYEKRPPPIVVWSCIGIIGAIIPSCKPRSDIIETDLIHRLPGLSQSMALKLNRFELKVGLNLFLDRNTAAIEHVLTFHSSSLFCY